MRKRRRITDLTSTGAGSFWVYVLLAAVLAGTAGADEAGARTFYRAFKAILARKQMKNASCSVTIADQATGRILYDYHGQRLMIPASNQKLMTSIAALDLLGPKYQFPTTVGTTGTIDGEVLKGDLLVVGGGDPNLSGRLYNDQITAVFDYWAQVLRKKGITKITGDLVADASFFDAEFIHPDWPKDQLLRWYCAPVAALSANDNCLLLTVKPGPNAGAPALVNIAPDVGYVRLVNRCKTEGKRVIVHIDFDKEARVLTAIGSIPASVSDWSTDVTIPAPPLWTATIFAASLKKAGIRLGGRVCAATPADGRRPVHKLILFQTDLARTVQVMNTRSQNFYAEQVFKTVGAVKGASGSWAAGRKVITGWATEAGIDPKSFTIADGSGMARDNRLSTSAIVQLLRRADGAAYRQAFWRSLPVSGDRGTLERRLKEKPYGGHVWAKTGYLSGVGALSGFATTRAGRGVVFSIIVNDFRYRGSVKYVIDDIVRAMIDTL